MTHCIKHLSAPLIEQFKTMFSILIIPGNRLFYGLSFLVMATLWGTPAVMSEEIQWQIGKKDNSADEFAISSKWNEYQNAFPLDCCYVINRSRAEKDWPYAMPGPDNGWGGSRPHTFTILFGLSEKPVKPCRFIIDMTDTHWDVPPFLTIQINDITAKQQLPKGGGDGSIYGKYSQGHPYTFEMTVDAMDLKQGTNEIKITSERGSWLVFDAIRFESKETLGVIDVVENLEISAITPLPCLIRGSENAVLQPVLLEIKNAGTAGTAEMKIADKPSQTISLGTGMNKIEASIEPVSTQQILLVELKKGTLKAQLETSIKPVQKRDIHLVHQTHLDIGYTHTQKDVLDLQVRQLKQAMEFCEKTKEYPLEARFKWHPEGMWAVEEFLRTATREEKERFIEATRKKEIHIDALYAQAMSGLYSEEEMLELIASAKRYGKQYDVVVDSAMQSDVPGYSWGLAAALGQWDVKYLSLGPNSGHRVGHTFEWGDKPFWWEDPSGKHRILFWMAGKGYSFFQRSGTAKYQGLEDNQLLKFRDDVFAYLGDLEKKQYPYDMIMMRYSIGSDNGPPDPTLSDAVRYWNEKYITPKLIITTNSDFLKLFEKMYGDRIPVVRGDFTPYWEDGAASTSADTSLCRRAAEQLVQAQTLWVMAHAGEFDKYKFDAAWTNLIMYNEHTWGAWNSISDPDSDFATQQANYKQKYALDGAAMTKELLNRAVEKQCQPESSIIDVYNTLNWERSELVILPAEQSKAANQVETENGTAVPSQRLTTGKLAFMAEDVPAFGVKRFVLSKGNTTARGSVEVTGNTLKNGMITCSINPKTGAVESMYCKGIKNNLVNSKTGTGVNDYLYILGRDPSANQQRIESDVSITIEDAGPLVGTVCIESKAPGTHKLTRRIRMVDGQDWVELINTVDKIKERRPESVSFDFPFNIPAGIMKIDIPWAVVEPEKDQITGSNKNFFCVQRWVDISNTDYGVTWVSVDAPIVQWDPMKFGNNQNNFDLFRKIIKPNQTIHSWVMNNHWETNYKADQEGTVTFRYVLRPHTGGYSAAQAQQTGRAVCQPLIAIQANRSQPIILPPIAVRGEGVVVTALKPVRDGKGYMVRLFNATDRNTQAEIKWLGGEKTCWRCNPMEEKTALQNGSVKMAPYEIVALRAE